MVSVKSNREIELMRSSGEVVALIHQELKQMMAPGITGKNLADKAAEIIEANGATPSFLGYYGFPDVICVSVNEQLIHGIPNDIPFQAGDIVKVDAGAAINGYHADAAFTVCIGNKPTEEQNKLLKVTEEALMKAISIIRPGTRIGDIGATIQSYVEGQGFYLPTSYTGHGIGKLLHEDPAIPNVGEQGQGLRLQQGMTICIEPMVQMTTDKVRVLSDQWTVVAVDKKATAHFEHTLLVTETGCEILTVFK